MKYPASEKLAIIQLVEQSHFRCAARWRGSAFPGRLFLSLVRSVLQRRHLRRSLWHCRIASGTPIADVVREPIIGLALAEPDARRARSPGISPTRSYFVSKASVYRLLKAHDLIASPAFIVMKARPMSSRTRPRRRISFWQTDF